jgi:hypothetical protein
MLVRYTPVTPRLVCHDLSGKPSNLRDSITGRYWLRSSADWLVVAILVCEVLLYFSEQLKWFSFNTHKGYTVLVALACMGAYFLFLFLSLAVAMFFRWPFQFSIRSLFVLFIVVAIPLGWFVTERNAAKGQADSVQWVRHYGACGYDWQYDADGHWLSASNAPPAPAWLRQLLGDDFFADVVHIGLNDGPWQILPDDLAHLECLTHVKWAEFVCTCVPDAGFEHLKGLKELRALLLTHNDMTDAGLRSLEGLTELRELMLDYSKIAGPGLEHLKGLSKLRKLFLRGMPITGVGVQYLNRLTQLESLDLRGTQISDSDLERIGGLVNLRRLFLDETQITDAGLRHLSRMARLELLSLDRTAVGDEGIRHLRSLTQLQELDLNSTRVTDAGIQHLKDLKQLRYLALHATAVTWPGEKELDKAIGPELFIAGPATAGGTQRNEPLAAIARLGPGVRLLAAMTGNKGVDIEAVAFVGRGTELAAVSKTGNVFVWDRTTLELRRKFSHFRSGDDLAKHGLRCACFSPDGAKVCLCSATDNLTFWDLATGKLVARRDVDGVVDALAVSDDAKLVAVAGFDRGESYDQFGIVQVWNPATDDVGTIKPKGAAVCDGVAFQLGGQLLAVAYQVDDRPIRGSFSLWDKNTLKCVRELPFENQNGHALRFDSTGRNLFMLVHRKDGLMVLRCWDATANRLVEDVEEAWDLLALAPALGGFVSHHESDSELRYFGLAGSRSQDLVTFSRDERATDAQISTDGKLLLVGTSEGNVYLLTVPDLKK